jgi:hypothetical protein
MFSFDQTNVASERNNMHGLCGAQKPVGIAVFWSSLSTEGGLLPLASKALRGNMLDMAVGIINGAAFGRVVRLPDRGVHGFPGDPASEPIEKRASSESGGQGLPVLLFGDSRARHALSELHFQPHDALAVGVVESGICDCAVAVLPGREFQFAGALILAKGHKFCAQISKLQATKIS